MGPNLCTIEGSILILDLLDNDFVEIDGCAIETDPHRLRIWLRKEMVILETS
jgi:hypothetical protein